MKQYGGMVIKLKRKKQINKRIILGFVIVLVLTFLISSTIYGVISKQYIIRQTKQELKQAAETTEESILNLLQRNGDLPQAKKSFRLVQELELFNQVLGTKVIVVSNDGSVLYPREGWTTEQLRSFVQTSLLNDEQYIYYNHKIENDELPYQSIIIYKKYNEVQVIRLVGIVSLLVSFGVGFIGALVIGILISQKIYKPISQLQQSMQSYMKNKSEVEVYKSNDEIEDLSIIFKQLTDKINSMDRRQKIFFQNSSHELKTPLMSIQGYVEAIKDGIVEGPEMDKSLDIIISETQRLKNIVDDVIYLSKIDNMEDEFVIKEHSLKHIIEEAILVVTPLVHANQLTMEVNCDESLRLDCDFDKMKRVFINLISNSTRYAKNRILVNVNKHENNLVIDVIDDGNGFEYGQEETVFDRFYKGKKGGSGIGLALSKEIIEKHGGTIQAINHMNFGAIFKIEFHG